MGQLVGCLYVCTLQWVGSATGSKVASCNNLGEPKALFDQGWLLREAVAVQGCRLLLRVFHLDKPQIAPLPPNLPQTPARRNTAAPPEFPVLPQP